MYDVQPRPVKGPPVRGIASLVVFALLLVAGGAVAFAAGPTQVGQSATAEPNASASPGASMAPGSTPGQTGPGQPGTGPGYGRRHGGGNGGPGFPSFPRDRGGQRGQRGQGGPGGFPGFPGGPGGGRGPSGGFIGGLLGDVNGAHAIRITAIDGNNLSLATTDGWTRTVDASKATITNEGKSSTVADLQVGDTIQLREQQNDDGTWSVTAINVVPAHAGGTVQAVTADSITLSHIDGSTTLVHISADTTYRVIGVDNGTLADIQPGNVVEATGTLDNDGSLDATSVVAFNGSLRGFPRGPWGNGGGMNPNASPTPSSPAANG